MAKLSSGAAVATTRLGLCVLFALLSGQLAEATGYYGNCPVDVEGTVKTAVKQAIEYKPSLGPALVRLLFHDCWVYGCDASVLLERTTSSYSNSQPAAVEKAAKNNIGLDGFDLIDQIKAAVGEQVSCADILAFAARAAAFILSGGNISYDVTCGRKDGVVSSAADADAALPDSTFSYDQLVSNFAARGFDAEELVILSGAHSVGVCHNSSFPGRILPSPSAAGQINPRYQAALTADVKRRSFEQHTDNPVELNNIRDMGYIFQAVSGYDATGVNRTAVGALDNSYYTANLQNMVLLKSDWELTQNSFALQKLKEYKNNATDWNLDFSAALVKLSELTGPYQQEIRKNCRVVNSLNY